MVRRLCSCCARRPRVRGFSVSAWCPFCTRCTESQRVGLEVNGLTLVERTFEGDEPGDPVAVFATIPADRVPDDGLLWIRLTLPDAVVPAALGINEDPRRLAVSLIDLRVTPA